MQVTFIVYGLAQPCGSKRSLVPLQRNGQPYRRSGGGIVVNTVDANAKSKPWQAAVRDAARATYKGQLLDGPLSVTFRFFRPRPKGHFGAGGVRRSAPRYPGVKPDVLKLARGCEVTGVLWRDDA